MNFILPYDLNTINFQRQFIENAIHFYMRQIEYQRQLLQELQKNTFWLGPVLQEQVIWYEKNIYFQQFLIGQYQQLLFSLKQMWDAYLTRNGIIPMDLSN